MRITITCEDCGHRHRLERTTAEPGEIWVVCHNCETPLQAVLENAVPAPNLLSASFASVWAGTLDLSTSEVA